MGRIMKKLKRLSIVLVLCLFGTLCFQMVLHAAGFSIGASTSRVAPGGSFTVNVSVPNASGMFYASGSNATVSPSAQYCDDACSFSVTAGSAGTASVTVRTGTPGQSDEVTSKIDDSPITGSQTVSVSVVAPSSNQPSNGGSGNHSGGGSSSGGSANTSTVVEEEPTVNLSLASLSVSEGTLSPAFSPEVTTYQMTLPRGTKKISVSVTTEGTGKSVEGSGEHKLSAGNNEIKIVVKAVEGNDSKTYTINAYVEEEPTIFLNGAGNKNMGVLSLHGAPVLEGFEDYKFKIDGKEVTGRKNTLTGLVVLYMSDGEDSEHYYIYDEKKKEITSIYIPIALLGNQYAIVTIPEDSKTMAGLTLKEVEVDGKKMEGWTFKDKTFKNYVLVYLMNEKGETHLYQYEKSENVLQLYSGAAAATQEQYDQNVKELNLYRMISFVLIPTTIVLFGSAISLAVMLKKKKV